MLFPFGLVVLGAVSLGLFWAGSGSRPEAQAAESEKASLQVSLADTYNAVTKVHFTNVAVHKGSPNPNPARRRFQADVKYWLMDARYYNRGALSIGNPELVDFVKKVGSKNLPAREPTTLPVMAYGIARAILDKYPIVRKVEIRLTHFSKGLLVKDEAEDNHVVNVVLSR
jgi:hypothetical protein